MNDTGNGNIVWHVSLSRSAEKKVKKLPESIRLQINLLMREIEQSGPIRKNWSNFSTLSGKGCLKMPTIVISRKENPPMSLVGA